MKYRAILFDMDGIIVDSEPLHQEAFELTFASHGVDMNEDDFKAYIVGKTDERGLRDYFSHNYHNIDIPEFIEAKAAAYHRLASENLTPFPKIVELIRDLSNQVPLALVTGSLHTEADLVLKTLDIDDCFDIVVTADDVDEGKPDPEGYLRAVDLLGKDPADCVVLEDSPAGVTAANEAGIYCIAVTNTHSEAELAHADLIVDKLSMQLFK